MVEDSATNYRYQKSINAFSFAKKGTKEKALQKENADFFALTPRGRSLLKKRRKTTGGCCANNARDKPKLAKPNILENKKGVGKFPTPFYYPFLYSYSRYIFFETPPP